MHESMTFIECRGWLPAGKRAAVCFNVDDVHPATSRDESTLGAIWVAARLGDWSGSSIDIPGCGLRSLSHRTGV